MFRKHCCARREFAALTGCRSGEVRGATWIEIDMAAATWTIPAARMKMARDHRVPLSGRALDVLRAARQYGDCEGLVFPSSRGGQMAANALTRVLARCRLAERMTIHGLRSAFRTWAQECTDAPHAVMELCLAHRVGSSVERAYARGELIEKRRKLMAAWSNYLTRG